jgi:ribonuclease Z
MKPTFHHRPVNGPFEDPALYVRLLREKRALLFDAGDISALSQGDIQKLTDVFVTHTHIDHFIGFDRILRSLLRRERPLRVFGPESITGCVEGKLAGYSWNLIHEYPLRLEVCAVNDHTVRRTGYVAGNEFRREELGALPFDGVILREEGITVRAVRLNHDIPCLGFSLEEDYHINIDKAALEAMGLSVGPWLGTLKSHIRENRPDGTTLSTSGRDYSLGELRHLAMLTRGQKVSYVMDCAPDDENVGKIRELVAGSDTVYSEAYFLHEDIDWARKRNHLTARLAGEVAREAGVQNLVPLHFSPRYLDAPVTPHDEAMRAFRGG